MSQNAIIRLGPADIMGAALSLPFVSFVLAVLLVGGILVTTGVRNRRPERPSADVARSIRARYLPERRTLSLAAAAVILAFGAENVIRGYLVISPDVIAWWRYATPVFVAFLGITITLGMILLRGTTPPESAVLPAARRTWLSFGPRAGLAGAGIALFAALATTIAAGLASSPDGQGQYVWLVIPVPNEAQIDPIRVPFYGWAYSTSVLVCLALALVASWLALHANAARPYLRPETVTAEREARRRVAGGVVRIATGGMLLALAGACRLIARSGTGSLLSIDGENDGKPYEAVWRYAELAVAAGWCAPFLEVAAFALLLLVAASLFHRPEREPASAQPAVADAEVLR